MEHLRTLVDHPDTNISNAAIDLVVARVLRNKSILDITQADTESNDETVRKAAIMATDYLRHYPGSDTIRAALPSHRDDLASLRGQLRRHQVAGTPLAAAAADTVEGVVIANLGDDFARFRSRARDEEDTQSELVRPADGVGGEDVRRRRRQVMVIHDGDGPITGDDIFQPSDRRHSA